KRADVTGAECLKGPATGTPVSASQTLAVESPQAVTIHCPSELNAVEAILPSCFNKNVEGLPLSVFQTRAFCPYTVTSRRPFGLKTGALRLYPFMNAGARGCPVAESQSLTIFPEIVRMALPSGLNRNHLSLSGSGRGAAVFFLRSQTEVSSPAMMRMRCP